MKIKLAPAWCFFLLAAACGDPQDDVSKSESNTLTFVHLNDTYRIDAVEDGERGGFARVASIVRELQKDGRELRLLHGGDFLFPSLESQLWAGEQMVEAMNFLDALAPMYVVPGNHEFDPRGADAFIRAVQGAEFEWLGDNMRFQTGQNDVDEALRQAFTFDSNGRTIGIFSLTLLPKDGGNVRDYAVVDKPYMDTARKVLAKFRAAQVDVVIGLTHLHMADDLRLSALRAEYPEFLFIVGGHEHEPEFQALSDSNAAIMKGASNARSIWQIDVHFDGADTPRLATNLVAVDTSIAEDPAYMEIATRWRARLLELMPFLQSTVGSAAVPLDGREVTVRNEESNWGNFIVDQMPLAFRAPPADLAFINSGTLRIDDFVAGDITFEDIGRTFGFSSYLRHMTIAGGDFVTLLEAGYRGTGPSKGYFPQIAGFRVCVDRSRHNGERIVQLQVPDDDGWQQIDRDRDYSLVAPAFLVRGGDGYDFSKARNVSRAGSELRYLVLDAIIRAQAQGRAVGAPVDPENPRIAFLSPGDERCFPD
ncbi:MAG: 5'-nucleotidase C-terminal domain-containing protein [Gammaproteobacteria bacterium]|nr:5'-nucleotidase C-terminal domain-containing protein [Gammaproteobacteria bacterium]